MFKVSEKLEEICVSSFFNISWSTTNHASMVKVTEVIGKPSEIKEGGRGLQSIILLLLEVPSGVCYRQHESSE